MEQQLIHNLKETQALAKTLALKLKGGEVIGLIGDLGAGKTTLVQFLAKFLGVKEKVNSPTFVLFKIYKTVNAKIKTLVHVDAYRLNNSDELKNIGLTEYFSRKDTVVIIEWADRVKDILPADSMMIEIKEGAEDSQRFFEIR